MKRVLCVVIGVIWLLILSVGNVLKTTLIDDGVSRAQDAVNPSPPLDSVSSSNATSYMEISAPFYWSACLLVKDDNLVLPEWLAYHYTVLPLRRLIVGVDPLSVNQPDLILDSYSKIGLNITKWTDEDYFYKGDREGEDVAPPNASQEVKYKSYLYRQRLFLTACAQRLKREKQGWTLLIDTDEYLVFNRYSPEEGAPWDCTDQFGDGKNKSALALCTATYHQRMIDPQHPRNLLPRFGGPNSTFAHFWHHHYQELLVWHEWHNRPCIVLPRIMVTAKELSHSNIVRDQIQEGFHLESFMTIRFRHHGERQGKILGKSILNVSGDFPTEAFINNPHRVLSRAKCKGERQAKNMDSIFRVQHYTGSKEVFMVREGRTLEQFNDRNAYAIHGETFEAAVGWLPMFVSQVGTAKAYELTEGLLKWSFAQSERTRTEQSRERRMTRYG